MNTNQFYGYALWIATFIFSLFLISQIFGIDFFKKNRIKREKW
jgi:hypothetical protein